jgi:hypothetical protein
MSGAPRVWRALSERLGHHALHGVLPKLGDEPVDTAASCSSSTAVRRSRSQQSVARRSQRAQKTSMAGARLALRLQAVLFLTAARSPFPAGSVAEYAS